MGDDLTSPAVTKHLIRLTVADWELIGFRHSLKPHTFTDGQLAYDVVAVFQFNSILFIFDGDKTAANFVDRIFPAWTIHGYGV